MRRRVIYSDNGTLSDLSVNLYDYHSGNESFTYVNGEDYLYIGARMPFNHLYFKFDTPNVNAAAISVQIWDSDSWRDTVDVLDETSTGGATFGQDGFITWVTDRNYGWIREDTNYGGNTVEGLTDLEIYDMYWLRISFSADLSATTLSWLGQRFVDDNALSSEFPDLLRTNVLSAYESGKTNWEEQSIRASEIIVHDLISKNLVLEKEQILNRFDFELPGVYKLAEIIFQGLGQDYRQDRLDARGEYEARFAKALPRIDENRNARIDIDERTNQGRLQR